MATCSPLAKSTAVLYLVWTDQSIPGFSCCRAALAPLVHVAQDSYQTDFLLLACS